MTQAVATAPVSIRLAFRYPNGSMVSYSARALSYDESLIHVVVNEEFEAGISLAVMAPFLEGLTTAHVSSVIRSKKHPGYFEMVLRFGEVPTFTGEGENGLAEGLSRNGEGLGGRGGGAGHRNAAERKSLGILPGEIGDAAKELANLLEVVPPRRLSEALGRVASESRRAALVVAAAAILQLLDKQEIIEARRLVRGAKEKAKK
jgi:hypothetical protein